MAYTTQYGLPQNVVNYLNQQLPTADIYGGITSVPFTFDDVSAEQQIEAQASGTLTPEQLRLLYLQQQRGGGEGREDDTIDTTNNAGITSLSDAINAIKNNITPASVLGTAFFGPIGGIVAGALNNKFNKSTALGNFFGFGPRGRDDFGNAVNPADVEIGLDQVNISPTNLNDYSNASGGTGSKGKGGGSFGDSVNDAGSFSDYS